MEDSLIKIDFMYIDEFGQKNQMIKTYSPCVVEDQTVFKFLVEEFKLFLITAGFPEKSVDTIQIINEE